ncbi:hypothetical protein HY768_08370 [candidate division TA06 bacterium]|uniref:FlgD/Vpr Ig-like domain-containing protein n=1 Tax=candidate division TA06 bacterium TaxID=2250710 RepID=A0A933MIL0_UNCT6|nr:hypothetical protein [candidate division TA06 bacterium]
MRKFIILALALAGHAWAQQWSPAINLMPGDPGSSWTASNQAHSLAVRGDTIYLVWYNSTWGPVNMGHQIYYKKFDGTAWGPVNILVNDTLNWRRHSWYPSCALDVAGNLHVVWESNDFGQISSYDIAYRKLSSNGSWSGITRVTSNSSQGYSWRPVIACGTDNLIHIAWQDNRQGTYKIFYKSSTGGGSWGNDLCLSPQGVYAGFPSIALSGSEPAVAWQDFRDGVHQIYFKKYSGSSWGTDSAISQSSYGAFAPCLAGDQAGNLHAAWEDLRDGNYEIYYRKFTSQTQSWGNVIRLTKDPYYSRQPFLLCQGDSTVNLFWSDDRDGSYEIYRRQSVNNVWQPETTLTNFDGSASMCPSAAVDYLGNLHLVWSDFGVSYQAPDIFYMSGVYSKKSLSGNQAAIPGSAGLAMLPAMPNPMRDRTKIAMMIIQSGWARVRVYNIAGQLVKELYQGHLAGGLHEFDWDAKDGNGARVSNGLYLTRAECSGSSATGKIMVVR